MFLLFFALFVQLRNPYYWESSGCSICAKISIGISGMIHWTILLLPVCLKVRWFFQGLSKACIFQHLSPSISFFVTFWFTHLQNSNSSLILRIAAVFPNSNELTFTEGTLLHVRILLWFYLLCQDIFARLLWFSIYPFCFPQIPIIISFYLFFMKMNHNT